MRASWTPSLFTASVDTAPADVRLAVRSPKEDASTRSTVSGVAPWTGQKESDRCPKICSSAAQKHPVDWHVPAGHCRRGSRRAEDPEAWGTPRGLPGFSDRGCGSCPEKATVRYSRVQLAFMQGIPAFAQICTATTPFGQPSLSDVVAGVRYARDHDYRPAAAPQARVQEAIGRRFDFWRRGPGT